MADVLLDGQLYFTAAPALAIARLCRRWSAEFLARRSVNGRPLIAYDAIQRLVADTLAEVHAVDSVIRWGLIGPGAEDRWFERLTAKNLAVRTAWRIVDRTVSLYGAEGVETLPSKLRRGAPRSRWSAGCATPAGCASPGTWTSSWTPRPGGGCWPGTTRRTAPSRQPSRVTPPAGLA